MRRFYIHGAIFTARSYGEFILKKQFKESHGATQDPGKLTDKQLEEIGLALLSERMLEDEQVYELDVQRA